MARWELCRIEGVVRDQKGFMNSRRFTKYIAVADTTQGRTIIDETPEAEDVDAGSAKGQLWYETIRQHQSALAGRLLAQGWEPIGENQFRRQVP